MLARIAVYKQEVILLSSSGEAPYKLERESNYGVIIIGNREASEIIHGSHNVLWSFKGGWQDINMLSKAAAMDEIY